MLEKVKGSNIQPCLKAAIAAGKILELPSDDDDDSEYTGSNESYDASCEGGEEVEDDMATQDYTWVLENGTAFRTVQRQFSCKWVYEKRGRRWEEPDPKRVIEALRAL